MAYLRGIGTLKIKVPQTETWTSVRRQLEELRLVQPMMNIRLDFAGGWENDLRRGVDLRPRLHDLADLAIEYVEDPVLPQSLAQVPRDILPIAADVVDLAPGEANRLVSSLGVRTLVVKPQLFGTWGAAINLIQMAQSKGIQVVLSSLYDGPVGIAALLHLAVALGLTESAQGLNTLALCTPSLPSLEARSGWSNRRPRRSRPRLGQTLGTMLSSALRAALNPESLHTLEQMRLADDQVLLVHPELTPLETQHLLRQCSNPPFWPEVQEAEGSGEVWVATSGTSGQSRIVRLSWQAIETSARAVWKALGGAQGDHWLCPLPLAHVAGLAVVERCRVGEGVPRLLKHRGSGPHLLHALRDPAIQFASLVPTQLKRLVSALNGASPPP